MDEHSVRVMHLSDKVVGKKYYLCSSPKSFSLRLPRETIGYQVQLVGFMMSRSAGLIHIIKHPLYSPYLYVFEDNLSEEYSEYMDPRMIMGHEMVIDKRCTACKDERTKVGDRGVVVRVNDDNLSRPHSIILKTSCDNILSGCSKCTIPAMFAADIFNYMEW